MFQLEDRPTYWWPVAVRRPDPAKPGEIAEHSFEAQFLWLDEDDYQDWLDAVRESKQRDSVAMAKVLLAVRNVAGVDGTTPEGLQRLLRKHGTEVAAAYFASRKVAAEKN
jgi:hypothetical protein